MEMIYSSNLWLFVLLYIIACHGIVQILVYSPLFDIPKEYILGILSTYSIKKHGIITKNINTPFLISMLNKFMSCSMCIGFWIGFLTTIFIFSFFVCIACGFIISATCYFLDTVQKMIEKKGE